MKVQLESTSKMVEMNGVPCRIWEGYTAAGIQVHAYIVRIAADRSEPDLSEFERELQEHAAPSATIGAIPLRFII